MNDGYTLMEISCDWLQLVKDFSRCTVYIRGVPYRGGCCGAQSTSEGFPTGVGLRVHQRGCGSEYVLWVVCRGGARVATCPGAELRVQQMGFPAGVGFEVHQRSFVQWAGLRIHEQGCLQWAGLRLHHNGSLQGWSLEFNKMIPCSRVPCGGGTLSTAEGFPLLSSSLSSLLLSSSPSSLYWGSLRTIV